MRAVFADTYYFLALVSPKDRAHTKALEFCAAYGGPIVMSTWVMMEVGDALCQVADRATFWNLLDDLTNDASATVIPATQELFDKAKTLFAARPD